jgi:hypothetical protein
VEAIRQYQADHELAVTGKIDPKLLDALGVEYKQEKLKADYSIPKKPAEVTIR